MSRKLSDDTLMSTVAIFGPEKLVDEMIKAGATDDDLARICTLQLTYRIAKVVNHKFQDKFSYQPASMDATRYLGAYMEHLMKHVFTHSVKLQETKDDYEDKEG